MENYISENGFNYKSVGHGQPLVIPHGLMGGLSNFEGLFDFFPKQGYAVIAPELPVYNSTLLNTNVKYFAKYVKKFIDHKKLKNIVLIGNSLGGHVGLIFSKLYPKLVKGLVLTGSSGLYENSMGDSYPKREDYNFIKKKTQEVFYSPEIATKEIVDEIFETVNDRKKLIKILAKKIPNGKDIDEYRDAEVLMKLMPKIHSMWFDFESYCRTCRLRKTPGVMKIWHSRLSQFGL